MSRLPRSTRTDTLFPDTPLFRSRGPRRLGLGGRSGPADRDQQQEQQAGQGRDRVAPAHRALGGEREAHVATARGRAPAVGVRSEEHTSELQSLMRISYAAFCLKKKKKSTKTNRHHKTKHAQ